MKMFSVLMPSSSRLAPRRLQLLALAEVGGEGDHLAAVGLLQPLQDDRGVEAARIGEHHLLHLLRAWRSWRHWTDRAGLRRKFAAHYRQVAACAASAPRRRRLAPRQRMPGEPVPEECQCDAELEFWYEFASTYSYLAAMRIEAAGRGGRRRRRAGSRSCSGRSSRRRAGTPRRSTSIRPRAATWCATWSAGGRRTACRSACPRLPAEQPAGRARRGLGRGQAGSRRSPRPSIWPIRRGRRHRRAAAVLARSSRPEARRRAIFKRRSPSRTRAPEGADGGGARERHLRRADLLQEDGELFWGNDRLEQALAWASGERAAAPGR